MSFYPRVLLFSCCFLFFCQTTYAQEICDNGIDDDNDGLIDLNDTTDCSCSLISVVESLFPNPSFDEFNNDLDCDSGQTNGAPDGPGQADCIAGWQQASRSTTDAWHLLTYNGNVPYWPAAIPQPIPSGLAVAGIFTTVSNFEGYREYLGSCLPGGPVQAGVEYRLNFQLGFAAPTFDPDLNYFIESPETEEFAIYGILDCANVPFGANTCPETANAIGWELITTFTATGTAPGWHNIEVDFTPDQPYAALAFGGTCAADQIVPGYELYRKYYFVDDLILNAATVFDENIAVGGISVYGDDICAPDARMTVQSFDNGTYQWYRDGIAIAGANDTSYYPPLDETFAGLYSCLITLPEGCGVAGPVEMIRPVVTNAFLDSVYICENRQVVIEPITNGSLVQSYLWQDGSTNSELVVDSAGTYAVTVTSFCEQTVETIVVTDSIRPQVEFVLEPEHYCQGDTLRAYISTDWQVNTFASGQPYFSTLRIGDTVSFVATTTTNIFFRVGGAGCFPNVNEDYPVRFEQMFFSVDVDDLPCDASTVTARLRNLGAATTDYTYRWLDAMGNELSIDETAEIGQPGNYSVEVSLLTSECVHTRNFTVGVSDDALVTNAIVPTLNCMQTTAALSVTVVDPQSTVLRWAFEDTDLATSLANITVDEPGDYYLFALTSDNDGDTLCFQEYTYQVNFNEDSIPILINTEVQDVCTGMSTASIERETGFENWTVNWFEAGNNEPVLRESDSVDGLVPGDYSIEFSNPNGSCVVSSSFSIAEPIAIVLTSEVAMPECPTTTNPDALGKINMSAVNGLPPYTFQLLGRGLETNETGVFTDLGSGTYQASVIDANGCVVADTASLIVNNFDYLIVEAGSTRQIKLGESVRLNVQSAGGTVDSIIWSPVDGLSCTNCENPNAAPLENTLYTVTYISADGCAFTDEVLVLVDATGKVYIPNAFTPNQDGVNDLFTFYPDQSFQQLLSFNVYDRWGGQVYEADTDTAAPVGWNGNRVDGTVCDAGVYIYQLEVALLNGETRSFRGAVTLLK